MSSPDYKVGTLANQVVWESLDFTGFLGFTGLSVQLGLIGCHTPSRFGPPTDAANVNSLRRADFLVRRTVESFICRRLAPGFDTKSV